MYNIKNMCNPADEITTVNKFSDFVTKNILWQLQSESAGRFRSRKALLFKLFVFRNDVEYLLEQSKVTSEPV